ncbi:AbiV family abortive infection protein [Qipengyuania sp. GH38]|uniref:AbiV family abortive infection protein n=1 Tax=Qipengyuania intermedia TaxID=2867244 RepID=UPI001C881B6D|nr:AbiV family abortive infection protein [Qipengyuania intermedia]
MSDEENSGEPDAETDDPFRSQLLAGARKAFDNAEQLYREARILGDAGATARALCLHQISLEECSKVDSLGAWMTGLVLGHQVDQKKVFAALSRHSSKNKTNAYMLEVSAEEAGAIDAGNHEEAVAIFKKAQEHFHRESNDAKNASLYVDWEGGEFVSPAERISEEMLGETRERNEKFLGYADVNLGAMGRLFDNSELLREPMLKFIEQAEKLREENSGDLSQKLGDLLTEFLEEGKRRIGS